MTEIKETELDKEADFLVYCAKGTRSSPCLWHQCNSTKQSDSTMACDDSFQSVKQPYPVMYVQVETGASEENFCANSYLLWAGWDFRKGYSFI